MATVDGLATVTRQKAVDPDGIVVDLPQGPAPLDPHSAGFALWQTSLVTVSVGSGTDSANCLARKESPLVARPTFMLVAPIGTMPFGSCTVLASTEKLFSGAGLTSPCASLMK